MHLDEISYEKANGVAEVTLDRPDRLNPISARDGGTRRVESADVVSLFRCSVSRVTFRSSMPPVCSPFG